MPFGDEITSTTNDREKFATYTRDSYTGLDYADQRFYASTYGRFNTPDQFRRSARRRNPESWNRYIYANDDPINKNDTTGRTCVDQSGSWADNGDGFGCPYASTTVSDWGSVNPNASGTTQVTSTVTYPPCPEPCGDNPLSATGAAIVQATGQLLNSISIGGFVYGSPGATPTKGVDGEVAGVFQCDSNAGCSTSTLAEVSVGNVTAATETSTDGGSQDILTFYQIAPFFGVLTSTKSGTFGHYVGNSEFGIGGYINFGGNTSTNAAAAPSGGGAGGSDPGGLDISSFVSAGFGGCGPAYCPNQ